jgi:acylphosphatase
MPTIRFSVFGRVQGVGFRQSTQEEARRLGLAGWVENATEGHRVDGVAQGPDDALAAFISWLQHGPRLARVDRVVTEGVESPEPALLRGGRFEILRTRG